MSTNFLCMSGFYFLQFAAQPFFPARCRKTRVKSFVTRICSFLVKKSIKSMFVILKLYSKQYSFSNWLHYLNLFKDSFFSLCQTTYIPLITLMNPDFSHGDPTKGLGAFRPFLTSCESASFYFHSSLIQNVYDTYYWKAIHYKLQYLPLKIDLMENLFGKNEIVIICSRYFFYTEPLTRKVVFVAKFSRSQNIRQGFQFFSNVVLYSILILMTPTFPWNLLNNIYKLLILSKNILLIYIFFL